MSLESPRFRKINDSFDCSHCGKPVPPAQKSCRDHCPYCLWSLHVDVNPGDRASSCGAALQPIGYEQHAKKGQMILYRCTKCGTEKKNKFLESDERVADSFEALLALTPKAF